MLIAAKLKQSGEAGTAKTQTKERLQLIELQLDTLHQQLEDQTAQLQQQEGQSQDQSQNSD